MWRAASRRGRAPFLFEADNTTRATGLGHARHRTRATLRGCGTGPPSPGRTPPQAVQNPADPAKVREEPWVLYGATGPSGTEPRAHRKAWQRTQGSVRGHWTRHEFRRVLYQPAAVVASDAPAPPAIICFLIRRHGTEPRQPCGVVVQNRSIPDSGPLRRHRTQETSHRAEKIIGFCAPLPRIGTQNPPHVAAPREERGVLCAREQPDAGSEGFCTKRQARVRRGNRPTCDHMFLNHEAWYRTPTTLQSGDTEPPSSGNEVSGVAQNTPILATCGKDHRVLYIPLLDQRTEPSHRYRDSQGA